MGSLRYMPQLDALRAIAVGLVFLLHFSQVRAVHLLQTGYIGVRLFFVLSGFLITLILLRYRDEVASGASSTAAVARRFYVRRFWRIVPPYYLFVGLMVAVGLPTAAEGAWWHLAYASNVWYAVVPSAFQGQLVHFWSLAVEEQFYLVWPFVVLLVPRRAVLWAVAGAIALGVAFRVAGLVAGLTPFQVGILMPGCLDALGVGALLAVARHDGRERLWRAVVRAGAVVGIPLTGAALWAAAVGAESAGLTLFSVAALQVGVALASAAVIAHASVGYGGVVGRALEHPALVYLGRISYGLYLYHFPMIWVVAQGAEALGVAEPRGALGFAVKVALTTAVASASWHAVERPLNGLKERLAAPRRAAAAVAVAP